MRKTLLWLLLCLLPLTALADQTVTLTFVGDCTIGGEDWLQEEPTSFTAYLEKYGYDYFFKEVQSIIANDDVTVANLEGVLMNHSSGAVEKTYNFRGPKHFVSVLTSSSVEAVNIANNHTYDYGANGVLHTTQALDDAGQNWFGTNYTVEKTWTYEKNNVKIGFVGMEIQYWYYKHRNLLRSQVEALKEDGCQVVVAVMHGGKEYKPTHWAIQEKFAKAVMEYGADIVIGHHPHILQGVDVFDGKTVCYSIGNFVFGGNAKIRAPYTALFQFTLSFSDDGEYLGHQLNIIPALPSGEREYNNYQPVLATGEDAQAVLEQIQVDTDFTLNPYVEGVGAVQDFVPAPGKE